MARDIACVLNYCCWLMEFDCSAQDAFEVFCTRLHSNFDDARLELLGVANPARP